TQNGLTTPALVEVDAGVCWDRLLSPRGALWTGDEGGRHDSVPGVHRFYFVSLVVALGGAVLQQHFSTSFFASEQYILPPSRCSQQHLSISLPVIEQRNLPSFSAAVVLAFFWAQQAGVFASPAKAAMLNRAQHKASAVFRI